MATERRRWAGWRDRPSPSAAGPALSAARTHASTAGAAPLPLDQVKTEMVTPRFIPKIPDCDVALVSHCSVDRVGSLTTAQGDLGPATGI